MTVYFPSCLVFKEVKSIGRGTPGNVLKAVVNLRDVPRDLRTSSDVLESSSKSLPLPG